MTLILNMSKSFDETLLEINHARLAQVLSELSEGNEMKKSLQWMLLDYLIIKEDAHKCLYNLDCFLSLPSLHQRVLLQQSMKYSLL